MPLRVLFFELGLGKTKQVSVRILDQDFLLNIGYTIAFVTANIMYQDRVLMGTVLICFLPLKKLSLICFKSSEDGVLGNTDTVAKALQTRVMISSSGSLSGMLT